MAREGRTIRNRNAGDRRGRRVASRLIPGLVALERRSLLSTLTVSNPNDSGDGSLRDAIARARPGDTIRFDPALDGRTIPVGRPLEIDKALTIDGPGAGRLTLDGGGDEGVFVVDASAADVILSDLTIADGRADRGGAIASQAGKLTVSRVTFADNRAGDGGAIFQDGGALVVSASTFASNRAEGDDAHGGAIYDAAGAVVTISDSRFAGNQAVGASNGTGGAIYNEYDVTLAVAGSRFVENRARGGLAARGGAIETDGPAGFPAPPAGSLSISGSAFDRNAAVGDSNTAGPSGLALGGAIADRVPLTVSASRFTANRARGGDSGPSASGRGAEGGAIYVAGFVTPLSVAIDASAFASNEARSGDGGIASEAVGGGAIALEIDRDSVATVTGTTFLGNRALGGDSGVGATTDLPGAAAAGGAILSNGSLTVAGSLLAGNRAVGGDGRGGADGGQGQGGAISSSGDLALKGSLVLSNLARGGRGATGGDGYGGGIATGAGGSVLTATDSLIAFNAALGGRGTVGADGQGLGGGIVVFAGTPTLTRTGVVANRASTDGDNIFDPSDS